MARHLYLWGLLVLGSIPSWGQVDSVTFKNGNYLTGEVKGMEKGVLTMKTPYSDSDFKIKRENIQEIFTQNSYLISLSDGQRCNGRLESISPDSLRLITDNLGTLRVAFASLIYLKEIKASLRSRLTFSIDLGFSLTRANNLRQFTSRTNVGYNANKWGVSGKFNRLISSQDNIARTQRSDGNVLFRVILPRSWYLFTEYSFLANTEQRIDLRSNTNVGFGKFIINTNYAYWGFIAGFSFNNESFLDDNPTRRSAEAYLGTELNLYDIGDLNLLGQVNTYPSLTQSGRFRLDFTFDVKYDLPLDFYIKLGTTVNFDNQPVVNASKTDYIIQTGFGWEW